MLTCRKEKGKRHRKKRNFLNATKNRTKTEKRLYSTPFSRWEVNEKICQPNTKHASFRLSPRHSSITTWFDFCSSESPVGVSFSSLGCGCGVSPSSRLLCLLQDGFRCGKLSGVGIALPITIVASFFFVLFATL